MEDDQGNVKIVDTGDHGCPISLCICTSSGGSAAAPHRLVDGLLRSTRTSGPRDLARIHVDRRWQQAQTQAHLVEPRASFYVMGHLELDYIIHQISSW